MKFEFLCNTFKFIHFTVVTNVILIIVKDFEV